ncbi:MAG TPA: alpha/beta hydrolase [Candidatus Saccharimonadales bacterium]|nr:alpha/beta hydrolase [Candidatus Saccharimonadales bacterium]
MGSRSGPVLLFLHGLGRFSDDYPNFAAEFAPHYQIVLMDFRGHGDSGRSEGKYLVTDYIGDTVQFIGSRFPEPIILYGHSLGAMVALAAATSIPERVRAIILEDPPFHTMGRRIHKTSWLPLFTGMERVCRNGGTIEEMIHAFGEITVPSRQGNGLTRLREVRSPEALAFGARCLSKIDAAVFKAPIQGCWLDGYDERELFGKVRCPSLLLQGDPEAGAALTDEDAAMAKKLLPHCRCCRFEGAGHLIRWERPREVTKAVLEFLETLPPVGSGNHDFKGAAGAVCLGEQPIGNPNSRSTQPHV